MTSDFAIGSLGDACGIEVFGIDVSNDLEEHVRGRLYELFLEHGLLLLRGQNLTPGQHVAFSKIFGDLDLHPMEQVRLPGNPEIFEIRYETSPDDVAPDNVIGHIPWHADLTYTVRPSGGGVLLPRELPERGGDTDSLMRRQPTTGSTKPQSVGSATSKSRIALIT